MLSVRLRKTNDTRSMQSTGGQDTYLVVLCLQVNLDILFSREECDSYFIQCEHFLLLDFGTQI